MKKISVTAISSRADLEIFAAQLKEELGLGFHPDDSFDDYVYIENKKPVYSVNQAKIRNKLITQTFELCDKEGMDIYETMGRIVVKGTAMEGMFD